MKGETTSASTITAYIKWDGNVSWFCPVLSCQVREQHPYSTQDYRGHNVFLCGPFNDELCKANEHELDVVHHYGERMEHWCPTGFVQYDKCGASGEEPLPNECTLSPPPERPTRWRRFVNWLKE